MFVFFVVDIFILLLFGKTIGVRNYRIIGHPLILVHSPGVARPLETDGAARGETELARAIPKYRANKSRVKLAWAMPSAADIQRS